jgi:hypothetical protein
MIETLQGIFGSSPETVIVGLWLVFAGLGLWIKH